MASYLTIEEYKAFSVLPPSYAAEIEILHEGWVLAQLSAVSSWINARLRKRYVAPFATPYPVVVQLWLSQIVDLKLMLRRGVDPSDLQFVEIKQLSDTAHADLREAADAFDGLFDLPLREDTTATGITKASPRVYTERSPYVWQNVQLTSAQDDDTRGEGEIV